MALMDVQHECHKVLDHNLRVEDCTIKTKKMHASTLTKC